MLLAWGALWIQPVRAQQPGNCEPALAENYLYINNVRARILNNGNLFWSGDPFVYEVPKGGGVNAIFSASIWKTRVEPHRSLPRTPIRGLVSRSPSGRQRFPGRS